MTKGAYSKRISFRPTDEQIIELNNIVGCGQYRTRSEVLRRILTIGIDKLKKEIKK